MCNRLSRRNRPWVYPQTQEEKQRHTEWKHNWIHGKNKYLLHIIDESNRAFDVMIGNNTRSNITKHDKAQLKGKNFCHLRPVVVKRIAKLDRYWLAAYNGELKD